jgi:hypothetical protein
VAAALVEGLLSLHYMPALNGHAGRGLRDLLPREIFTAALVTSMNGVFEILMEFLSWKSYLPEAVYQGHLFSKRTSFWSAQKLLFVCKS